MEKEEIYKIIPGYEHYSVSNLGNVITTETGKPLKIGYSSKGHLKVVIHKDGKPKSFGINKLIDEVFKPPKLHKLHKVHKFMKHRKPKAYNPICVVKVDFNPKPIFL